MALGTFNEALIRAASFDQVKAWLSGGVGNDSLPAKPRIDDVDRVTIDNEDTTSGVPLQVTSTITTGGPAIDVSVAALTTGKALDISNLTALTTGKALHIGGAAALTTGILAHIEASATAITGAGRLLLVNLTGATSTSGTVAEIKTDATDETIGLQLTHAGTGNDLVITNTNGGALGPKIETYHNVGDSAAADDDVIFRLISYADDEEASSTKRKLFALDVQWTDATAASFSSDLEMYLANSTADNLALTLTGGGQMGLDLDSDLSASSAAGQIFDDYDDAQVLQRYAYLSEDVSSREATLLELELMGVVSRKPKNRNGFMLNLQPMIKLLCGGIYQTRDFMENHVERLNRVIDGLETEVASLKEEVELLKLAA